MRSYHFLGYNITFVLGGLPSLDVNNLLKVPCAHLRHGKDLEILGKVLRFSGTLATKIAGYSVVPTVKVSSFALSGESAERIVINTG